MFRQKHITSLINLGLIILLHLPPSPVMAQQEVNTDSLLSIWNNTSKADTLRMQAFDDYCRSHLKKQADTVVQLSTQLFDFATKTSNPNWQIRSLKTQSDALRANYQLEKAILSLEKALTIAENQQPLPYPLIAMLLDDIGFTHHSLLQTEKAETYANRLIELAEQQNLPRWLAKGYNIKAITYQRRADTKQAALFNEKAIAKMEEAKDTHGIITYINNYTSLLTKTGEFDKALGLNQKAIDLIKASDNDPQKLGRTLKRYGDIYEIQGNYPLALKSLFQALQLQEARQSETDIAGLNNSIGALYQKMKDFDNALLYLNKAYDYYYKAKDQYSQVILLVNIGTLHKEFQKPAEKILYYYEKAYQTALALDNPDMIAFSGASLASMKLQQGELTLAEKLIKDNLSVIEKSAYQEEIVAAYHTYAAIKKEQGFLNEARTIAQKAYKIANDYPFPNLQSDVALLLFEIEKARGNSKAALNYFEAYTTFQDTLYSIEKRRAFTQLELQHEYTVKQVEDSLAFVQQQAIMEEKLANSRTRTRALAIGGSIVLLLSGFIFFLYRKAQKARRLSDELLEKEKEYNHALEQEQAKVELKSLCKQMDPHFMFNSLQSISHYVDQNDRKAANKYLANFAKLMRQSMNYSQLDGITLEEEIEILSIYLDLEVLRFGKAFTYTIFIEPDLDLMDIAIPPMLIQPHVENAIWHGLRHRQPQAGGHIDLRFTTQDNYLICEVIDNGVGREKSSQFNQKHRKNHQSFGKENMLRRIELLNKLQVYPISLEISDNQADVENIGTKVELRFPIE